MQMLGAGGSCRALLTQVMGDRVPPSEGAPAPRLQDVMDEHGARQSLEAGPRPDHPFAQMRVVHPAPAVDVVGRPEIVGDDRDPLTGSAALQTQHDAVQLGHHAVGRRFTPPGDPVLLDFRTDDDRRESAAPAPIGEDPGSARIRRVPSPQRDRPADSFPFEGAQPGCLHPKWDLAAGPSHVWGLASR